MLLLNALPSSIRPQLPTLLHLGNQTDRDISGYRVAVGIICNYHLCNCNLATAPTSLDRGGNRSVFEVRHWLSIGSSVLQRLKYLPCGGGGECCILTTCADLMT